MIEQPLKTVRQVPTEDTVSNELRETDPIVVQARERVLGKLNEQGILTQDEASNLQSTQLNELMVRFAGNLTETGDATQEQKKKIRRVLGLPSETGDPTPQLEQRKTEIRELTKKMRTYLESFRKDQPIIVGMVLCGSRMDAKKIPDPKSDVDIVLILKSGTETDPRTPDGERTLFAIRGYSDTHATEDGQPVEVDELYSADAFKEALQSSKENSRMIWGWNPNAVTYIGDGFEDMNEEDVGSFLTLQLKSETADALRRQMIHCAAQTILGGK
ncbi:MAG: hypothetical protein ABIB04_00055 [Patescibacteria group bacterium]